MRVVFTGDPLPSDKRADLVPVEREGSADEDLLEDSSNRIEEYFRAQGYRDASAPHTREASDGELASRSTCRRGGSTGLRQVDISGNASVPLADFAPRCASTRASRSRARKSTRTLRRSKTCIAARVPRRARAVGRGDAAPGGDGHGGRPVTVRIVVYRGRANVVGSLRSKGNRAIPDAQLRATAAPSARRAVLRIAARGRPGRYRAELSEPRISERHGRCGRRTTAPIARASIRCSPFTKGRRSSSITC